MLKMGEEKQLFIWEVSFWDMILLFRRTVKRLIKVYFSGRNGICDYSTNKYKSRLLILTLFRLTCSIENVCVRVEMVALTVREIVQFITICL